jgi:hypothetical protein
MILYIGPSLIMNSMGSSKYHSMVSCIIGVMTGNIVFGEINLPLETCLTHDNCYTLKNSATRKKGNFRNLVKNMIVPYTQHMSFAGGSVFATTPSDESSRYIDSTFSFRC